MHRIIDANINRATEGLRVLEEISRFHLDDKELSEQFKLMRHKVAVAYEEEYEKLLAHRDTQNDVGVGISNPTEKLSLETIFKSNIKRLQQSLRTLAEYTTGKENQKKRELFENLRYESYTLEKELWRKLTMKLNKYRLADKKLYLVTNSDQFENDDDFIDAVAAALNGGVQLVQLREKKRPANEIIQLGKKIRQLCSEFGALFIVNDRIDIAQIVEADGVHLGQDDVDIHYAREILGSKFIIGISTHCPEQALKAQADGADYIGVGPVFVTPTKAGRAAVGLDYVKFAAENIEIPFFAIGGIDLTNVQQVLESGATRVAVVRAIINAQSPSEAAEGFREKLC